MNVALLTTETSHHLFFAAEVAARHQLALVVVETGALVPPFETRHPFEDERDAYERENLLGNSPPRFEEFARTVEVESVDAADSLLRDAHADVALVFGTRRLAPTTIAAAAPCCLNLHGGDPERYRGLDTHLWAIYHRDFANLVTTLHRVDPGLDTGDIVLESAVPLASGMRLHEFRAANAPSAWSSRCSRSTASLRVAPFRRGPSSSGGATTPPSCRAC